MHSVYTVRFGRVLLLASIIAAVAAVAAYGSATTNTSSHVASSSKLPPTPPADGANVAGAQQYVLQNVGQPKFTPMGPDFNIKLVKKPVWFISPPANAPPAQNVYAGFAAAGKAAGVPTHLCLGAGTPEGNALCLQEAAAQGAGSAVWQSIAVKELVGPITRANAAGVKTIAGMDALRIGEPTPKPAEFEVSHNYLQTGELVGGYAVAAKGGALDAMCINIPDYTTATAVCAGFTQEVHKFCPKCKVTTKVIPSQAVATELGADVSAAALSDPHLDFIMDGYDYLGPYVETELKALGKTASQIMVGGENGTLQALSDIRSGNYQALSVGQDPYWWGWGMFDAAARAQVPGALTRAAVQDSPNVLFTRQTFHYTGSITYGASDAIYGLGNGALYKNGFLKEWKLK